MLLLLVLRLFQLSHLVLFPQNTRIVVNVILEDWLPLLQVERQKSIRIIQGHLGIE